MKYPIRRFKRLYHVGTLDPTAKKFEHGTFEGRLLSVSVHPEEWRQIARLGTSPTWTLSLPSRSFQLVDLYRIGKTAKKALVAAAIEAKLLIPKTLWEVVIPQEDGDISFLFEDLEKARQEEAEDTTLQSIEGFAPTRKLSTWWGASPHLGESAVNAAIAYLAGKDQNIDGVWWNEELDVYGLSAPRGGLFPRVVKKIKKTIKS